MAKIVYITDARLPTEKAHGLQIMKTCEALVKAGNELTLVAPRRRNSITADPFDYYKIATRFPVRRLFTIDLIRYGRIGFFVQIVSFSIVAVFTLPRRGYDLLYGRDEIILATLSLFGFRSIVWESHDGAWNLCARYIVRRSRKLVVVSGGLRDWYIEKGVAEEKIIVIPNAIDPEEFSHPQSQEAARRRLGLPLDVKIALYIGRLDGWKGTDTLLEASKFLSEIKIALIGGDVGQVEQLKLKYPNVIFLGYRPYSELPDNQSAADVLVVPNTGKDTISVRFTSPLKLIAHLSSNRPIVASDLPSIREIVGDDAALLVPADDPKALAEGIKKVIEDPVLGAQLAQHAREHSIRYTWIARAEMIGKIPVASPNLQNKV
jgi:glycosyltransferase involved in cell wall biosynthesis